EGNGNGERGTERSTHPLPRRASATKYSTRVTRPQLEGRYDGAAFHPPKASFRSSRRCRGVGYDRGCRPARCVGNSVERRAGHAARSRQQARRMALLGWRRVEYTLLHTRSDQRDELQLAAGRLAVERWRL